MFRSGVIDKLTFEDDFDLGDSLGWIFAPSGARIFGFFDRIPFGFLVGLPRAFGLDTLTCIAARFSF